MRAYPFLIAALLPALAATPAAAQSSAADDRPITRIIIAGDQPCPPSTADEIIVCAREPGGEEYRIPEEVRDVPEGADSESWAARAESLETVGESGPMSCSTIGPNAFTGCWAEMMRQSRREREQRREGPER